MQKRAYGETGQELSIVGFGGIVVMGAEQSEADRRVRDAFDRGINYYDVAPSYGDAEEKLGPALVGLRDQVFLACKTGKRTKAEATEELHASLKRLHTDRFDLYQLHAVSSVEEAQTCLGPGGAIEAFVEARDAGLVKYLGFSAHSAEAALLLLDQFPFQSVLFPFNYTTYYTGNFGPQVLEKAQQTGAARLALKAMARRPWPDSYRPGRGRTRASLDPLAAHHRRDPARRSPTVSTGRRGRRAIQTADHRRTGDGRAASRHREADLLCRRIKAGRRPNDTCGLRRRDGRSVPAGTSCSCCREFGQQEVYGRLQNFGTHGRLNRQ
jgi:aryl-alcohol dehydrogenase-like predicted oxidoreductase